MLSTYTKTPSGRKVVVLYWALTLLFGLFYGLYGYYSFWFLDRVCAAVGIANPLSYLLVVLAASMLFESVAEPLTGRFADLWGRRRAVVLAFALMTAAFMVYSLCAGVPSLQGSMSASTVANVVTGIAIAAEFCLAIGLSFQSGAMDAWLVDQLSTTDGEGSPKLEQVFARSNQVFTIGLTVGSTAALTAVSVLPKTGDWTTATPIFLVSLPWFAMVVLALFTSVVAQLYMTEDLAAFLKSAAREAATAEEGYLMSVITRAKLVFQRRETRAMLTITAGRYLMAMLFLYFAPLLLSRMFTAPGAAEFKYLLPYMPLLLFLARFGGPELALRLVRPRNGGLQTVSDLVAFRFCGVAAGLSLLAIGALGLRTSNASSTGISAQLTIFVVLVFLANLFLQACRSVQPAYVNRVVLDPSDRAFTNSMAIPVGALLVAIFAGAIRVLGETTPHASYAIAFEAAGILGGALILVGTIYAQKYAGRPALAD